MPKQASAPPPPAAVRHHRPRHGGIVAGLILATIPAAEAHFSWLELVDTEAGQVQVEVVFGHHPPGDRRLPPDRVVGVDVIAPDGNRRAAVADNTGWHGELGEGGSHVVVARQHPSFWSRTVEGGRNGSRREYPDALSCRVSDNTMKTIVAARVDGDPAPAVTRPVGHPLDIMPETDPTRLSAGDSLTLRVLLHGQPWQGTLRATWAGYPSAHDDDYPVHLDTGPDGRAVLELSRGGTWLVHANAQADHPDPEVCDRQAWNAALSFTLR